jgi:ABC-2 type transport system permease protein
MFVLLLKSFLRSRIAIVGLAVVLLAGIISIYIGKQYIQKQKSSITKTEHFQQEHIERNVQFYNKETGLLLYYLRFSLINTPHPLNALSIGQRDVNSSIQSVTIRNLENQKYDTDLFNPFNLLTGNLDFAFVLIYLFPLLIISFTYNLLSEEKEGGTWQLLLAQSANPAKMLMQKLAIRAIVVLSALTTLLLLASLILSLPFDSSLLATIAISVLYLLVWFAISFWVVSLQKRSSTNAVLLLSIWMLLTVIIPGAANNYITGKYPVPEALSTVVEQREGLHEKWDIDKKVTMDKFYAHYPQFRKYPLPDKEFSWLWYYAMQQMGDDDAREQAVQMRGKLWQREKVSRLLAYFVPTLHAQHQLNTIARSGLRNHLQFLDSTTKFHEKMRLYFYPKIFEDTPVINENRKAFTVEYFSEHIQIRWLSMLAPVILLTGLFVAISWWNFRRVALGFVHRWT